MTKLRKEGGDYIYSSIIGDCPIPDVSIYDFMFNRSAGVDFPPALPDSRVAMIDDATGRRVTYGELRDSIDALAKSFYHDLNIRREDVVCFYGPNHLNYLSSMWGLIKLGAVMSGANPSYTRDELAFQVKLAKAKYVFAHPVSYNVALEAAKDIGMPAENVILFEAKEGSTSVITIDQLEQIGKTRPEAEYLKLRPNEAAKKLAFLSFSSGTSGLPKGVMISHRNVIANVCQLYKFEVELKAFGHCKNPVSSCFLPFYHIYGLVVLAHSELTNGAALCVIQNFEPNRFLESVKKYQISHIFLVPPIIVALLNMPREKLDVGFEVTSILAGAAPLGADLTKRLRDVWPSASIRQGWGMTETATACSKTTYYQGLVNSQLDEGVGILLPYVEYMIVDPNTMKSLPPGHVGELWVRGPNITMGYYENEKATADTYNQRGQGWLRSGDEGLKLH